MTGWRHPSAGSEIDRARALTFRFDGQSFTGYRGDTLASALLASGQRCIGRSFKYHRPRGLWGMGAEEPNAIVDLRDGADVEPNARATLTPLKDGMELRSVNAWPNARRDIFGWMDLAHRFIPAGFYYKTMMRLPWKFYEPLIRRAAGLGRLDGTHAPPADCPRQVANCDVLVIGAGPAGLAAARAAARRGKRVWLVEDAHRAGGALRWRSGVIDEAPWQDFVHQTQDDIANAGGRVMMDTTLWAAFDHGTFAAWQRGPLDTLWRIRATETIVAAGAIERPLWFANNDRPGVMSAEAALFYLTCHGVLPGRRVLLATASDRSTAIASALGAAGAEVILVDARPDAPDVENVEHIKGARVTAAHGRSGVTAASLGKRRIACDAILCAGGMTPTVHLWCQAGGKLDWDATRDVLVPRPGTAPMVVIGGANGTLDLPSALAEGHRAGGGEGAPPFATGAATAGIALRPDPALPGRQWIDMQNDVTLKDVALAHREGFRSVEHLKRYTTLGMATDQGRSSNFAGLAAMADLTGKTIPETGTTTYRPPFKPTPLNLIGGPWRGDLYHAPKRLALEEAHASRGARFREYGGWLRPSVYGAGDEAALAQDEARTARQTVAIFDASPLGKLEVIGPRAAELLDFTSYIRMSTVRPGRARYGFNLSESGVVYDDGVVLRLEDTRFIVSASSSHVDGVRFALEDARQDRVGRGAVFIHDVTQAYTTLTVTGPRASTLLADAGIVLPVMPHMSVLETKWQHAPLRVARISFTGDVSYELSVPTRYGEGLRAALDSALGAHEGRWIGLEAVMILRAEKGYILIGKDTDGLTMPHDLGWGGPRDRREDEYLGKRSLFTEAANSERRRQLVGLTVPPGAPPLPTGAHLVPQDGQRRSLGFVTSSYLSPTLGRPIALALLEAGQSRIGETVKVFDNGAIYDATVAAACSFDPKGERLHG
ncbi:2Fe-2S iron-sulfur cluster-binding protein [Roseovarius aquimarinus]|uniref:2Fe-2S iron-sulfur cluster-binding protein n=1 Tax=Roseovarius aquimarinus TaxID=1229156 RepID=A0ABW7ICW0_9RHOB